MPMDAKEKEGLAAGPPTVCSGLNCRGKQKKSGGLGNSHTAPCGAAVPARPPTRSSETTHLNCASQWVRRATGRGTSVVVHRVYREPNSKLGAGHKHLIISKIKRCLGLSLDPKPSNSTNPKLPYSSSNQRLSPNHSFTAKSCTSGRTWPSQGKAHSTKPREDFSSRI